MALLLTTFGSFLSLSLRLPKTDPGVDSLCARSGGEPSLRRAETVSELPRDSIQVWRHLRCSVQSAQRRRRHLPLLEGLPRHLQSSRDVRQADEIRPHLPKLRPVRKGRHDLLHRRGDNSLRIPPGTCESQSDKPRGAETDRRVIAPNIVKGIENSPLVSLPRQRVNQVELELHLSHDRCLPSLRSHRLF